MLKKSIIVFVIVMTMSVSLLAGCGGGGSQAPQPTAAPAETAAPAPAAPAETAAPTTAAPAETAAPTTAAPETAAPTAPAEPTAPAQGGMSETKALEIALADAGVAESDAVIVKDMMDAEHDDYDDIPHYDVNFYANDMEYEYDIHAETGEIIGRSQEPMDAEDYAQMDMIKNQAGGSANAGGAPVAGEITEDAALQIALQDAGVKMEEISRQRVELDIDDHTGKPKYDVEFHVGQMEYNYEIDQETGAILEAESDFDD